MKESIKKKLWYEKNRNNKFSSISNEYTHSFACPEYFDTMRIIFSQGFNLDAAYCHCLCVCVSEFVLFAGIKCKIIFLSSQSDIEPGKYTNTPTLCKHVQTPWATAHRHIKMDEGMTHENIPTFLDIYSQKHQPSKCKMIPCWCWFARSNFFEKIDTNTKPNINKSFNFLSKMVQCSLSNLISRHILASRFENTLPHRISIKLDAINKQHKLVTPLSHKFHSRPESNTFSYSLI